MTGKGRPRSYVGCSGKCSVVSFVRFQGRLTLFRATPKYPSDPRSGRAHACHGPCTPQGFPNELGRALNSLLSSGLGLTPNPGLLFSLGFLNCKEVSGFAAILFPLWFSD